MRTESETLITSKQVLDRYAGISAMTLSRWLKDKTLAFPKPLVIQRRRYFRLEELQAWEKQRAAR